MPLTEEVDKDAEYSAVKVDAGCTPKLSRRKSVANDCGRTVVEITAKRTPGSCHESVGSSWLCAVKKSTKHVVENKRKACCSSLQLPVSKMVESVGWQSASNVPIVTCDNNNEAASLYDDNKRTSSPWHLKSTESADSQWRQDEVTTRGRATRLTVGLTTSSKSSVDSRCRRRSQSVVVGGRTRSPAMRTDAGHTPLKIRRRCCGKKYSERLIN